jgi:hypothetical protein
MLSSWPFGEGTTGTMIVSARRVFLVAACVAALPAAAASAKSDAASPPAAGAGKQAAPPEGYWIVATSEGDAGLVGGAFSFRKDGWDFFTAKGDVKRVDAGWSSDGRRWTEAGAGPNGISLERSAKELVLSYGGGRAKAHLQPASAARAAELARAQARVPAPADACRQAEACCKKAMPLMGGTCDVAFQLGDRSTSTCTSSVTGMKILLAQQKIPIPPECK